METPSVNSMGTNVDGNLRITNPWFDAAFGLRPTQ